MSFSTHQLDPNAAEIEHIPPFERIRSVHNTVIEGIWSKLVKEEINDLRSMFSHGRDVFDSNSECQLSFKRASTSSATPTTTVASERSATKPCHRGIDRSAPVTAKRAAYLALSRLGLWPGLRFSSAGLSLHRRRQRPL
ncbi:hypothetical protein Rhopal_000194-T1 [Rhodotorula paludigena]|uniref:Uncharacterized protein n=1 Tax=Rhodotorula paludigena TaxID=86838 RepID=A0AAV5G9Z5_9BASI|nr:hypothetical protein Rhopal_000194-T1 [Rhodotorula paludigena]